MGMSTRWMRFPRDPSDWRDTDGDGIGDRTDTDDDGDGVADAADPLPLDGSEVADFDGDLIGDNADPDDDNDRTPDGQDLLPKLKLHRSRQWHVPLFPTGFKSPRQGLVRIFGGDMHIGVADGAGRYMGGLMLPVAGNAVRHLSSQDLRNGRPELGLGAIGVGRGDWRLVLGSPDPYDQQVLAYVHTPDGFIAPMHDVAPDNALGRAGGSPRSTRAARGAGWASCTSSTRAGMTRRCRSAGSTMKGSRPAPWCSYPCRRAGRGR